MRARLASVAALVAFGAPVFGAVSPPVLKWQRGGCTAGGCQTGWYSSPAVADLNGDGQADVVWGSYDVVSLNGATGAVQWRGASGNRVWPGIALADLTGDGTLEVIVGRNADQVTVYDRLGNVVWTRNPFGAGEVRTLAVDDLENDGQLEVVVGRASGGDTLQVNVFEPSGVVRPGWPARHVGDPGYGWGMYNENVAVADLNGDGFKEIFAPTDTHYITALDRNGNQLGVNAVYAPRTVWSQVGVHVDEAADLVGYADCGIQHRPNFANSAPVVADVDGDGTKELVVIGDVYNCAIGDPDGDLYHLPFILKLDRTRWSGSGYDWTVIPNASPGSGPLSQDYAVIQNSVQDAVVADLDGDGQKEILYSSYDGRVHAYWLDKTEHGNWPYRVPSTGVGGDDFRFAGEPVVADLDNDGHAEVIFTSWPKNGGNRVGHLHVLDYLGNELYRVALPAPFGDDWNGGLGAPTLANIDGDPDLEVVVGTWSSGVVAFDLPNTADAHVLWGTGRGNFKRTGTSPVPVPLISAANAAIAEGNAGHASLKIPITLSVPTSVPVRVGYATSDGTASAGSDYQATSGVVVFPPGSTAGEAAVTVNGDRIFEANETFAVNFSSPTNGTLATPTATGTITNDDAPGLSIDDVSVTEPPAGTRTAGFTVTLAPTVAGTVTVQYATADGTATAPGDYTAATGTLTFPPNVATRTIPVTIKADALKEPPETFTMQLSNPTGGPAVAFATGTGRILDPGTFFTVTPCRVADTRGAEGPALSPGTDRVFAVAGRCGMPASAVRVDQRDRDRSDPGRRPPPLRRGHRAAPGLDRQLLGEPDARQQRLRPAERDRPARGPARPGRGQRPRHPRRQRLRRVGRGVILGPVRGVPATPEGGPEQMATRKKARTRLAVKGSRKKGPERPPRSAVRKVAATTRPKRPAGRQEKARREPETLRLKSFTPSLTVDDLSKSIVFYTETLGFFVSESWTEGDRLRGVMLKAGACELGLSQDDWKLGRDREKGAGFRIWCDTAQDVDALAARVKGAGFRLTEEPEDHPAWGVRSFSFDDPDGFHLTIARGL